MYRRSSAALLAFSLVGALLTGCAHPLSGPNAAAPGAYAPIAAAQIARQPMAGNIVELAYSARRHALYVAAPDWEDAARSRVLQVNPQTLAIERAIATPVKGFGVALDDAGERLYLSEGSDGSIGVVDLRSGQQSARISLMDKVKFETAWREKGISGPRLNFLLGEIQRFRLSEGYAWRVRELAVDAANHRLYAPGLGFGFDSVLFVIDTRTLRVEKVIDGLGFNAVGIALDAGKGRLFVSNMQGQVKVFDARSLALLRTLEVQADQLLNLAYDATTNRLWGVDQGYDRDKWRDAFLQAEYKHRSPGQRLVALDADTGAIVASAATGVMPVSLALAPERGRVYVTNRGGTHDAVGRGSIGVYDAGSGQLLETLALPPHPNSLAYDAAHRALYVTIKNDQNTKKEGTPEQLARITLQPGQ